MKTPYEIKDEVVDFINTKALKSPVLYVGFNRFSCCTIDLTAAAIDESELNDTEKTNLIRIENKVPIYVPKHIASKLKSLTFDLFKTKHSKAIIVNEEYKK